MQVRLSTFSDLDQIGHIYNDVVIHSTAIYHHEPRSKSQMEAWYQQKLEAAFPVFVAEVDGIVVGFSTYGTFKPLKGYDSTVENSIHLLASHRQKGLGSRLMTPLITAARLAGKHCMLALIDAENIVSISFHEKFGFKQAGKLPEVGYKFDRWLDVVMMTLTL
jgi:phosphinothricin acetyltransferase